MDGVCDPTQCPNKCCFGDGRCGIKLECYPLEYSKDIKDAIQKWWKDTLHQLKMAKIKWMVLSVVIVVAAVVVLLAILR